MTNYLEVKFQVESEVQKEILNYHLGVQGVESIVEDELNIQAYFAEAQWASVKDQFTQWNHEVLAVKNENWNAVWEASFEPVLINDFCYVRAPFHPPLEDSSIIDLILEPKMAFGTAHHETTFMMMSQMENIDFKNKTVFDFGCGTAILSILAEKIGAKSIYAIDIEENAVENANYNAKINACNKIVCEEKVLEQTTVASYDIILANINRAVLLASATTLTQYLKEGGFLLLSGILIADEDLVKKAYTNAGFQFLESIQKGEWKCLKFTIS